jgi:MoCo/4Fe-4S cofactor protein with predicted Tat translocation signal
MKRDAYSFNDTSGAKLFWRSIEEKDSPDHHQAMKEAEFPLSLSKAVQQEKEEDGAPVFSVDRRSFLKFGTAVTALFGLDGCVRRPVEKLIPYTRAPEQVIPGVATHYASVLNRRGEALGVLVESHEGRPTKIEGNPEHPSSRGGTDLIAQAVIWDLYDPDRSGSPLKGKDTAKWEDAQAFLADTLKAHEGDGGAKLHILAEPTNSPTFVRLRDAVRARFPQAHFHTYSSVTDGYARDGARLAFGQPVNAIYDYARARVIVSLDSDFLQTEPGMVRSSRLFGEARKVRSAADTMSRLYVVESAHTLTGANADHRLRLPSGDIERYARLLAKELTAHGVDLGPVTAALGQHPADGIPEKWIKAVAKELGQPQNRGRAVVVAGSRQPPAVHALAHAINRALGSVGQVVQFTPVVDMLEQENGNDLRTLTLDMEAGKVETLVILGGNPVYDAPGDVKFESRLAKVKNTIHLSSHVNETSEKCAWHLPRAHELEAWGDQRSLDGTWSIQQPLILPLHGGKSDIEVLAWMAGGAPKKAHELVRETIRGAAPAGADFEKQWRLALQKGLVTGSAPFAFTPTEVRAADIAAELSKPAKKRAGLEVAFFPCPKLMDGRHANNPWLLELPDPMTKVVWDNVACVSAATAAQLGVQSGDVIEILREGARVKVAAWIQPGQADGSIAVYLGWGRKKPGRYGVDAEHGNVGWGFDVNPLRSAESLYFVSEATAHATGEKHDITQTQEHHSMEGRPVAIDTTLDEYKANPIFPQYKSPNPKTLPLWNKQDYSKGHQWGMAIDLTACTGCGACVVACQAENNIPVVGKTQVGRGRELHWLRIDRYFVGNDAADPQVAMQPLACVQCEEAPCENVCPVNATEHSPEGLNDMAYNRCIGTRYCANNCPYKVRRFNYLEFQGDPLYGDMPETVKMQFNPNVTVRMRGVMEKCTYCVQRIQEAKIGSKRSGQPIRDGELKTACEQACPGGGIVFGDLNDPRSRVVEARKRDRGYALLAELGTHPRTTYLGKIRNPNKEMG